MRQLSSYQGILGGFYLISKLCGYQGCSRSLLGYCYGCHVGAKWLSVYSWRLYRFYNDLIGC